MKMMFSEQALIRVWRNAKILGKLPTTHIGHAAMTVKGITVPTVPNGLPNTQHISFWPQNSVQRIFGANGVFQAQPGAATDFAYEDRLNELLPETMLRLEVGYRIEHGIAVPPAWTKRLAQLGKKPLSDPKKGQKRIVDESGDVATEDVHGFTQPVWSQSPDAKVYLPGVLAGNVHWGLNLGLIAAWWKKFMDGKPDYQAFATQNCAGIVLWALQAGGSDMFVKAPNIQMYAEPTQVEQYALAIERRLHDLEFRSIKLASDVGWLCDWTAPATDVAAGLWTVTAWKKASELGALSPRSSMLQKIDQALTEYQKLTWKDNWLARYEALLDVFLAVVEHRDAKAGSKRTEAVLKLASQVLNLLKAHRLYDV